MSRAAEIEQAAASWLVRKDGSEWSEADEAGFAAWLDASPEHEVAFYRLENAWQRADRLAALRTPGIKKVSAGASRWWKPIAMAASLALVLLATVFATGLYTPFARGDSYATAVGVRSTLPLPDGSRIELNTDTSVRTDLSKERRLVWLDQGEAYFDVARDPSRVFEVRAGDQKITVLGTKFSVRRTGDDVRVSVVEGRVRVDGRSAAEPAVAKILQRGEIAIISPKAALVTAQSPTRVAGALSWRQGMVAFDQDTLFDAAAEFNRYNRVKLVVADPELGEMTLSGRFEAANIEAFVRLLHRAYGLQVRDEGDQIIISK